MYSKFSVFRARLTKIIKCMTGGGGGGGGGGLLSCIIGHYAKKKNILKHPKARSYRAYRAIQTILFSSPLILLRCIMEIKFAQNLR